MLISCTEGKKELMFTVNNVTYTHFCASISRYQHQHQHQQQRQHQHQQQHQHQNEN